jgi:hypothetical protein
LLSRWSPDAHHLSQKFLGQVQIGPSQLVHAQQPFACSRLDRVDGVTSRRLLHLGQEELLVFDEQASETWKFSRRFAITEAFPETCMTT